MSCTSKTTSTGLSGRCKPKTAILLEFHGQQENLFRTVQHNFHVLMLVKKKKAGISSVRTSWMGCPPDKDLTWLVRPALRENPGYFDCLPQLNWCSCD